MTHAVKLVSWEMMMKLSAPSPRTAVYLSSLALWLFVFSEGRRRGMKNLWLYVICNLAVGVSLALPLFLFFREQRLKAESYT